MSRRVLVVILLIVGVCAVDVRAASAACVGGLSNRREMVGDLPDVFFTFGTPGQQRLKPVHVNFDSTGSQSETYGDCQLYVRSNVPGIFVTGTYGCSGAGCSFSAPGEWAAIDVANGPVDGGTYALDYFVPPDTGSVTFRITYDGGSPVAQGTLDFAQNMGGEIIDEQYMRIIGHATVYITPASSARQTWFRATSAANTVSGDSLILDNDLLNGKPSQRVFVSHFYNGTMWNHPIATTYDTSLGRWKIRNEDGAAMPSGLAFNVRIDPSALRIQANQNHAFVIDDRSANGNPNATILVTPNTNGNLRFARSFAVTFNSPYWYIVPTNGALPFWTDDTTNNIGFFAKVFGATQYIQDFASADPSGFKNTNWSNGAGTDIYGYQFCSRRFGCRGRTSGNSRYLSEFCWTTNTSAPLIVTANQTPLPAPNPSNFGTIVDPHILGVWQSGTTMAVYHEDNTDMGPMSPLNIWGPYRADCPPN